MQGRGRLYITCDAAAVLLIIFLWFRTIGSFIALSLTADKVFVPIGADPIWPPAANIVSKIFYLLAVMTSVGIILFRMNDITRPGLWRITILLAPWLYILTRGLYAGGELNGEAVLYVLVMLALAALRPRPRVLVALGALVVLTAIIAIAFGFLMPEAGLVHGSDGTLYDRPDKAVFPSLGLLQGMFTAENSLGVYLAIGLAAVAILPRLWRFFGFAVVGFAIAWSSARNSLLATGFMLLLGSLVWAITQFGWPRLASLAARLAIGAAVATMCALPLSGWLMSPTGWDGDAYTGRGVIWNGSLTEWSTKSILFGFGRRWYERIVESDTSTLMNGAYSGHNEFVHLLATGGVVFAFLTVGALLVQAYFVTMPRSRYLVVGAMLASGIAVSGWLEVPLRFVDGSMYWTVTVVPLAVLFLALPENVGHESRST